MKNFKYKSGFSGFLAEFRYAIGGAASIPIIAVLSERIPDMPANGELGFLGLIGIAYFFAYAHVFFIAALCAWVIASGLKALGTTSCSANESEKPPM